MALTGISGTPDYAGMIAAQLARLHFLPPPAGATREPALWGQIARFLDLARSTTFDGVSGPAAARAAEIVAGIDFIKAAADFAWLKDAVAELHAHSEPGSEPKDFVASARSRARTLSCRTVFAHNDL
jgi:hypothetical protein